MLREMIPSRALFERGKALLRRRFLRDAGLFLFFRLMTLGVTLAVFVLVSRKYGISTLGQYSYATTIVSLLPPLFSAGIEPILIQRVVRAPENADESLGISFVLNLILVSLSVFVSISYFLLFETRNQDLLLIAIGLSMAAISSTGNVLFCYYRAVHENRLAVTCALIGQLIGASIKLWLIYKHAPVYLVTGSFFLDAVISYGIMWGLYSQRDGKGASWTFNANSLYDLLALVWPSVFSGLFVALFFRISHVLVAKTSGSIELGYYSIAFQLFTLLQAVPSAIMSSAYPTLVELHETSSLEFDRTCRNILVGLQMVCIIALGGWLIVGPSVLSALFGVRSVPAFNACTALIVTSMFSYSGALRGQLIYILMSPKVHIVNATVGLAVLLPLSYWLTSKFQALGAACALSVACFVSGVLTSFLFKELRTYGVDQLWALILVRRRSNF